MLGFWSSRCRPRLLRNCRCNLARVVGDTRWTPAARVPDICSEQKSAKAKERKTEWSNDRQSLKWWDKQITRYSFFGERQGGQKHGGKTEGPKQRLPQTRELRCKGLLLAILALLFCFA